MYADMMDTIGFVKNADPEVGQAMERELLRQRRNLELIASENIVSPAVMAAMGSVLTNKYAEGYPGKRYYGGCQEVDVVENIARERPASCSARSMPTSSPIRRAGQPGGVFRPAGDRRHSAGDEPGPRRASDPRIPGQFLRQAVQLRPLRRGRGDRLYRL